MSKIYNMMIMIVNTPAATVQHKLHLYNASTKVSIKILIFFLVFSIDFLGSASTTPPDITADIDV